MTDAVERAVASPERAVVPPERAIVTEIAPGLSVVRGTRLSAHAYVVRGQHLIAVIDTGAPDRAGVLVDGLAQLGLAPGDVGLVVNTHEHFDHVGGNGVFPATTLVAAHHSAARKIAEGDRFVTLLAADTPPPHVGLRLRDGAELDLGGILLEAVHSPGHTSGSMCLFEPTRGWLFSGDTLFAGGVLSYIAESGSVGDYLASLCALRSLRLQLILPGHGKPSSDAEGDIARASAAARSLLAGEPVVVREHGKECPDCA